MTSMTLILACATHWETSVAFFAPVIVLPLGMYLLILWERRHGDPDDEDHDLDDRDLASPLVGAPSPLHE
jgi:hypothetical protein